MVYSSVILIFLLSQCSLLLSFNPFMDNDIFMINWAEPMQLSNQNNEKQNDNNNVVIMTKDQEKYQCILPESEEDRREHSKNYDGPTPDELMETLFQQNSCSYRIESYWTYELCHNKYLRQYHETKEPGKKPKVQEYFLGYKDPPAKSSKEAPDGTAGTVEESKAEEKQPQKIKTRRIDGIELPYFEVNMTDGTNCDLLNAPRRARLLYVCQPEGRGEILDMKESSTCEYEIMVLTSVLCSHPDFRPKNPPVNEIQCHSLEKSPSLPKSVEDYEPYSPISNRFQSVLGDGLIGEQVTSPDGQTIEEVKIYRTPKATKSPPPPQDIGTNTDKQILRDFLNGDYCLQGGSGWWKHEFCYGKHARQYHDGAEGRQVIYLGYWNYQKHTQWLNKNPTRRPRDNKKHISLYYTDGDICDLTGDRRVAEVKLKCVHNEQYPHHVALYLMEPSPCSYILGIESPLFCKLLDKADNDGIFKVEDVDNL